MSHELEPSGRRAGAAPPTEAGENRGAVDSGHERKSCPYCAESVRAAAIKCRYCGSRISAGALGGEWYRRRDGRMLAGVCTGLAENFGVSVTALRLGLVVFTLIGFGWGIPVYLVLWVIMPLRGDGIAVGSDSPAQRERQTRGGGPS